MRLPIATDQVIDAPTRHDGATSNPFTLDNPHVLHRADTLCDVLCAYFTSSREQMSIPARIMMIADIFEALTARDRPYKARKKLSECIDIMARMSREHHIDPDLFELFLTSGVYHAYADIFLLPEQIDEIDVARHLGQLHPPEAAVA